MEAAMDISIKIVDSVTVIGLDGSLDSRSAPTVQESILGSLPEDGQVLLDLGGLSFVSSAGLRTMLLVYRQAQCVNTTVALVGLSEQLRDVLSATGFLGFFLVSDSVEGALAGLRVPQPEESGAV
jgi:anti-sigma B factor antagonist